MLKINIVFAFRNWFGRERREKDPLIPYGKTPVNFMIPFFGHHSAKQSLPMKPIRYGFKMFCLNQSSGHCLQFEP